jgi:hypothetical protein
MNISPSRDNVVKSGTFLYDDSVLCDICVVLSPIRFGTGDYEDHFEVREDVKVDTYYLFFGSTTERGLYSAGGGGFSSLNDAMKDVENRKGIGKTIKWDT